MQYNSKKDWWLMAILFGVGLVMIASGVPLLMAGQFWLAATMFVSAGFMYWIVTSTRYAIAEANLVLSCGPVRWRIPLVAIEEVFPDDFLKKHDLCLNRTKRD